MAALNPFRKPRNRGKKRSSDAIDVESSEDNSTPTRLPTVLPIAEEGSLSPEALSQGTKKKGGRKKKRRSKTSSERPAVEIIDSQTGQEESQAKSPGPSAPAAGADKNLVALFPGAGLLLSGAGSASVNGRYASHREEDGTLGFKQEGGEHAVAFWAAEPGSWAAGWYLFLAESEEGVYCCTSGDEAHFPLVGWKPYAGEESKPGILPGPTAEICAAAQPEVPPSDDLLPVAAGTKVLLRAAGCLEVNGNYVAQETEDGGLQFQQEPRGRFAMAWWEEQPGEWRAGWYIFTAEDEEGCYFSPHGDEGHFPIGRCWAVYDGESSLGKAPAPRSHARVQRAPTAASTKFVYVRAGLRIAVADAGCKATNGTYVAAFDGEGALRFKQRGGPHAIAWWDAEPGQWQGGWYLFSVDDEEGLYCHGEGDEARLPLGAWLVYKGPAAGAGREPAPSIMPAEEAKEEEEEDVAEFEEEEEEEEGEEEEEVEGE